MKMKATDLRPGDIPAIATPKGFLPKAIRVFMWLWMLIHYKKIYSGRLFNHTMLIVANSGRNNAEAISRGFVIRNFITHYSHETKNMVVFRLKNPLTDEEIERMQAKAREMAARNIEYEYTNFLWWAAYIVSNGKWDLSPKGEKQDDKVFCFEVSAILIEAARPGTFTDPSKVTTADLMMDDRFEMLEFYNTDF